MQYSVTSNNNALDSRETSVGASPKLRFYSGAKPANCAAAAAGTLLCEQTLPADWMNAAAGTKTKLGTWTGVAVAAGVIGHFRIYDNAGATCHIQGTASDSGTPDMVVDNATVAIGQTVIVNTFTLTPGNT